jgi:hypothetical protein
VQDREQHLHSGQVTADGLISFAISVSVVRHPAEGSVRYRDPLVHGTPAEPFLHLSLRPVGGEPTAWMRRIKVRFPILTWEQVEALPDSSILSASVSGERCLPGCAGGLSRQTASVAQRSDGRSSRPY